MRYITGVLFFILILSACSNPTDTKIRFVLRSTYHKKFFLERIPFQDSSSVIIDSGITRNNIDSFEFLQPAPADQLFQVRIEGKDLQIPFINDTKQIRISCDYASGKYHIEYSPASIAIKEFQDRQKQISESTGKLKLHIDSMVKNRRSGEDIDSCIKKLRQMQDEIYSRKLDFCDTVTNPAAFITVYDELDFGRDYAGLKKFILRASERFPSHIGVQQLTKKTLDYIGIFQQEYQVGDSLPELLLPDEHGIMTPIYLPGDKYTLIDFWSTWDPGAQHFSDVKKKVKVQMDNSPFTMVSIAIDAEKQTWEKIIQYEKYSWPQLIDEMMWKGPAVRTLHFDSIPFNFLVDPHKRIVAKAIPADSLLTVLARFGLGTHGKNSFRHK